MRNIRCDLWEFFLDEQHRRRKDGKPSRNGDLLNEALALWRDTINPDPLAKIRREQGQEA